MLRAGRGRPAGPGSHPSLVEAKDSPSVLAVLVVKDGADWLKRSLAALARQSHGRLGVIAVDNASTDGSGELLRDLLGPGRVVGLRENAGFPGAVARAMEIPAAREADFLLLLHDDTVLDPDAVARLVAAAGDGVGVVGPKVLDGERRRMLREIGFTIDRFGYRYSALEQGEIDQGQHDSPREVLFVSGAAMLVARDAWLRAGPPDARLRPAHGDLDFCWRVRIAGFRVVMDPSAVAYHGAVGDAGRREGARNEDVRYLEERSALTAMLKNYRLPTLLWVMPMYVVQGLAKVALFLVSRRFGAARQVLAAWGWTLLRFPGTVRRRVRLHAVRAAKEREVNATMAPTSARLRRWAGQVSAVLFPGGTGELAPEDEVAFVPLRERVGGFLGRYPTAMALGLGLLLTLFSFRGVLFASPLQGGAMPTFPDSAMDLFARYLEGTIPAGFGGADGASPALVPLGLASLLTLGNPRTLAWLLVALTPLLAGATAYRVALRRTGARAAAVTTGVSYALSAVVLWAVSEGSVGGMVFLIGLPWILGRIADPFEKPVGPPFRWALGTAVVLAITGSFFPAVWAPVAIATVVALVVGGPRGRLLPGAGIAMATLVLAVVLAFPFVLTLARIGVGRSAELGIAAEFGAILTLSPGAAPGSWLPALFLPIAGVLGFVLAKQRRAAWRCLLMVTVALPLAWLAAAGYLPSAAAEPVAYLGLAAFALSILVGLGFASVAPGVERGSFGGTQIAFGLLALIVGAGVLLQAGQAVRGAWAVGEDRIAPAYPVVATSDPGWTFRVLWVGRVGGGSFPPPGGPAEGVVEARGASVRYAVTGRSGRSILSVGLPPGGPGYEELERALRTMLAGRVRHGGSLLAPFAVAFVVAGEGDLPAEARARLDAQLDLLPGARAGGLVLYRNTRAFPVAGVLPNAAPQGDVRADDPLAPARTARLGVTAFRRVEPGVWAGSPDLSSPATAFVSKEYEPAWVLRAEDGAEREPFPAFGWAVGFEAPAGSGELTLVRRDDWVRTAEVGGLAVVWVGALWVLRRRG